MNREEAIYYLKSSGMSDEQIKSVIDAFTCDDCISRAKALEMLGDEPENWTDTEKEIQEVNDYRWFKSILEELPSVTPQRPNGKWLDKKITIKGGHGLAYGRYGCSVCKKKQPSKTDFCPNCGAKMEVEE